VKQSYLDVDVGIFGEGNPNCCVCL